MVNPTRIALVRICSLFSISLQHHILSLQILKIATIQEKKSSKLLQIASKHLKMSDIRDEVRQSQLNSEKEE